MSPRPLSILLGSFRIFSKIRGDIREWKFVNGVNELSLVHFTPKDWIFAGVIDTAEQLFADVVDTGDKH